jgi:UPF0176 protein
MENPVKIVTFYQFADFPDYRDWKQPLLATLKKQGVRGTILLASEGLNATLAGPDEGIAAVLNQLKADSRFDGLFIKESYESTLPFERAKVRLKKEIITLGKPANAAVKTGQNVSPAEWNKLLSDPDVLVLDTRNSYETHLGTFENAIVWPLERFNDLPEKILRSIDKKQKVAMFCTGGVRCEKLSSWMLNEGYDTIYQLEGGIVHYLNEIPAEQNRWQGECYVFDERIAVGHHCEPARDISLCPACGHALTPQDRQHPAWLPAIQCGFCVS